MAPSESTQRPPDTDERRGPEHARALRRRVGRQSQWLALFFGFATALAFSVVFLGDMLGSVADEVSTLAVAAAIAVVVTGLLLLVVYATRDRLFRLLRMPVPGTLGDVLLKLRSGLTSWTGEDHAGAVERIYEGASSLASWLAWARLRTWMLATVVGSASIFALLIGEVLILRQNQLIEEQNAYLRAQNGSIRSQLSLEAEQSYLARRTGLVAALYDRGACATPPCAHRASLRARVDAARAFTEIELGRRADALGTQAVELCATGAAAHRPLDLRHLDLSPRSSGRGANAPAMEAILPDWLACGVDLTHADLTSAALPRADLRRADLRQSVLTGIDLTRADLSRADLSGARMADAGLRGARLTDAIVDRAWLRGADLSPAGEGDAARPTMLDGVRLKRAVMTGADLRQAGLRGADLTGADLTDSDLSGADLRDAVLTGSARRNVKWSGAICPDGTRASVAPSATCEGHLTPRPSNP